MEKSRGLLNTGCKKWMQMWEVTKKIRLPSSGEDASMTPHTAWLGQINRSWKVVYNSYMLYIYNMICSDVICVYIILYLHVLQGQVRATNQQIGELDLGDCEAMVKSLF